MAAPDDDLLRRLDVWLLDPVSDVDTQQVLREARARIAQIVQEPTREWFDKRCNWYAGEVDRLTARAEQAEAQLRAAEARVQELEGKR